MEQDIADIEASLSCKQLRIGKAKSISNWSLCDQLHQESHQLKQKLHKFKLELHQLQRKQQKSKWYVNKKAETKHPKEKAKPKSTSTLQSFFQRGKNQPSETISKQPSEIICLDETNINATNEAVVGELGPQRKVTMCENVHTCHTVEAMEMITGHDCEEAVEKADPSCDQNVEKPGPVFEQGVENDQLFSMVPFRTT